MANASAFKGRLTSTGCRSVTRSYCFATFASINIQVLGSSSTDEGS